MLILSWRGHGCLGHLGSSESQMSNAVIVHGHYTINYKISLSRCLLVITTLILLAFSLLVHFSRITMILPSLALLSGMVLFSSAAPWSQPAPVTHYVNVSNDTAGLLYDPSYIVSQPKKSLYNDLCADMFLVQSAAPGDTVSFKFHPKNHTVTQSSFDAPCTPLYGGTDTGLCVSSLQISLTPRVF